MMKIGRNENKKGEKRRRKRTRNKKGVEKGCERGISKTGRRDKGERIRKC